MPGRQRPSYKDSQGRLSYRLCDNMVGSTMGFVFENHLPAIYELMQEGCDLYNAARIAGLETFNSARRKQE
jgi:hypothetical protein